MFYSAFFEYQPKWCTYSAGMAGATWNCSHLGASPVYTIQPCHFMQSHIRKVYACLAVTCHLHFWQNDRDLLHATVVTRGWNGYRNYSQHRKLTLEKKILPPFQQGFKPVTFQSRVRCFNHWAIPTPQMYHFIMIWNTLALKCFWWVTKSINFGQPNHKTARQYPILMHNISCSHMYGYF